MLDPKLLTLIKVAEVGSYTLAARKLNLTQPAVSQHVKELEKELGISIFRRHGLTNELTPEGEIALGYAKRIASLYGELGSDLKDLKMGRRSYIVGITHTAEASAIAETLARYAATNAGTKIKVKTDSIKKLYEKLGDYEIDFAIVDGPLLKGGYSSVLLDTDSLVAVMGRGHPLSGHASLTTDDLKGVPMILRGKGSETRSLFSSALSSAGLSLESFDIVLEIDNIMTIKELLAKNEAVSVLPRSACYGYGDKEHLCMKPIENLSMSRQINLVYDKDYADKAFLDGFVRLYREVAGH